MAGISPPMLVCKAFSTVDDLLDFLPLLHLHDFPAPQKLWGKLLREWRSLASSSSSSSSSRPSKFQMRTYIRPTAPSTSTQFPFILFGSLVFLSPEPGNANSCFMNGYFDPDLGGVRFELVRQDGPVLSFPDTLAPSLFRTEIVTKLAREEAREMIGTWLKRGWDLYIEVGGYNWVANKFFEEKALHNRCVEVIFHGSRGTYTLPFLAFKDLCWDTLLFQIPPDLAVSWGKDKRRTALSRQKEKISSHRVPRPNWHYNN